MFKSLFNIPSFYLSDTFVPVADRSYILVGNVADHDVLFHEDQNDDRSGVKRYWVILILSEILVAASVMACALQVSNI